ncbi:septal ring lytic transglycosylase RlpA family protein [Vibrio agarivorans]|uniref:Endolytic peptidoglycan transglycosylase RlpA n=1 Tax=Vibrio agarivorans TaxID=153622 RepID=A0ABT7Y164_9VIBR|nr:septal ring lytic transglycosylase RlpA family protein [Vibrio agarivorans]MDN2481784.1 septal ring lytic transglycosylase RlpA family protein [Vibrio agarivorans]
MKLNRKLCLLGLVTGLLFGCSSPDGERYDLEDDVPPQTPISVDHIEGITPRYEPYSLGGNKDYTLRGQDYTIVKDAKGFTEKGKASWYGKKFHGHLTSNGEIYDMYSMTAAHKTLPLPSYVKVTNVDNGKQTIVRVNDRGPFHEGRIIDLSYAAAHKLGVVQSGVANVEIEVITVEKPQSSAGQKSHPKYIIQVASSQHKDRSEALAKQLSKDLGVESFVQPANNVYRILLGPFADYDDTQATLSEIKGSGHSSAFIRKHAAQ